MERKNVVITGGSGMVGGLVLHECLGRGDVGRVTSLVRRSSRITHPKLREVIVADFLDLSAIDVDLKDQDVCFFCIGIYTGAAPEAEFRKITVDYTASFATALKKNSPNAAFCFLSGDGADRTEKSWMMFARAKGAAENFLARTGFARLHCFRPGYIYPVQPRKEPNTTYVIFRALWKPLFSWLTPGMGLTSVQLAHAMVKVGLEGGAQEILSNKDITGIA